MDLGAVLKKAWDIYIKNFVAVFVGFLIVSLICTLPVYLLGLLLGLILPFALPVILLLLGVAVVVIAGPLAAGLVTVVLAAIRGEKTDFGKLFAQFGRLGQTFVLMIILAVASGILALVNGIPVLGSIMFSGLSMIIVAVGLIALAGLVDRGMGPVAALQSAVRYLTSRPLVLLAAAGFGAAYGVLMLIPGLWSLMGLVMLFAVPLFIVFVLNSVEETGAVAGEYTPPKQIVQIVGLSLAGLIVLGAILSAVGVGGARLGFGGLSLLGRGGFGVSAPSLFSRSNDFTLTGKDEHGKSVKVQIGVGLPREFPKDVPIYPKSEVALSSVTPEGTNATFNAKATLQNVFDFYERELPRTGWTVTEKASFGMTIISATKDTRELSVGLMGGSEDKETIITLTVTPKKND